jgi:hypothetical protein
MSAFKARNESFDFPKALVAEIHQTPSVLRLGQQSPELVSTTPVVAR